jgi:hypothetical protein
VVLKETEFATNYSIKAYPFDLRDQFKFVSDLTDRGKDAVRDAGAQPVTIPQFGAGDGR